MNSILSSIDRSASSIWKEGAPVLADPTVIARQYRRSLQRYLEEMDQTVRDTLVDYHRVCIEEPYDDVLARFLLARTRGK